jgi:hypothetical protein
MVTLAAEPRQPDHQEQNSLQERQKQAGDAKNDAADAENDLADANSVTSHRHRLS